MLEELKKKVCRANKELPGHGLVVFTWGNVSAIDRETGLVVIKPSGVEYDSLTPDKMVVVDLDGKKIEGELNPSSDTPTHVELYKAFPEIGGIVHTHSRWATIYSQMCVPVPALGTTHADYFHGEIPVTAKLTRKQINGEYEKETGIQIVKEMKKRELSAEEMSAVLVASHGPFTWGKDADEAVYHAVVLEEVAFMAWHCALANKAEPMQNDLLEKHYQRKHGKNAYYGQIKQA